MSLNKKSIFSLMLLLYVSSVTSYKYLAVLHMAARSHHIVGMSLLKGLAEQGHEITVISPFPSKTPLKNIREIGLPAMMKAIESDMNNLLGTLNKTIIENIMHFHDMGIDLTKVVLTEPEVQKLLKSNEKFDAVIVEVFLSEALFGLAEHFKAPLIGLGPFGATTWNTDMIGSPSPPSYVPHAMLRFSDRMSLTERVGNLAFLTFERIFLDYFYMPRQEALYKQYFPSNKLTLAETRKSASLVLLNQHVSLSFPRPYVPNHIEVGGMHINRKRKPLPTDIEKFINESKHGVIYFSMGSNLKSKLLPLDRREAILNTFRGLKQRVLWKFEDPELPGKPDNVFISDWFPQDDILAHENVKAFITHGGLLSTTESIYHGKPFIGIPIFGDQFLNMARAEQNGYGIKLDYNKLDPVTFKAAIEKILNNKDYTKLVGDMSARYRDQPDEPLKRAIFWVEHVTRHKGAQYLHCAGVDLNFWQYHNIDAMVLLYGGILFVLGALIYLIRVLWGWLQDVCAKKEPKKVKKN